MYCHRCGSEVPEGALYCPRCGTKLVDASTLEPPTDGALADETAVEEALWGGGESERVLDETPGVVSPGDPAGESPEGCMPGASDEGHVASTIVGLDEPAGEPTQSTPDAGSGERAPASPRATVAEAAVVETWDGPIPVSDPRIVDEDVESYTRTEVREVPFPSPEPPRGPESVDSTRVYAQPRPQPQAQPQLQPQPQSEGRTRSQTPPPDPAAYRQPDGYGQREPYGRAVSPLPVYGPGRDTYPRTAGAIVVAVLAIVLIAVSLCPWVAIPQGIAQLAGGAQEFLNGLDLGSLGSEFSRELGDLGLGLDFDLGDLGIDLGGLGLGALNLAGGYAPWSMYGLASLLDTITESAVMIPGAVAIVACWVAAVICLVIGIIGCLMPGGSTFARASSLVPVGSALMIIDAVGTWFYAIYADGVASAIIGAWLGGLASDFSNSLDIESGLGEILLGSGAPVSIGISLLNVTFWLWIAIVLAAVTFVLSIAFRRRPRAD